MTPDTRTEVAKKATKKILRWIFVDYFYITLIVLGLIVALLPVFFPDKEKVPLFRASAHVGEAILTAGAVTTFMRFFASLDIVGQRIEKWLGNETYLKNLTSRLSLAIYDPGRVNELRDLTSIWRNITLAMTRHAFPDIATKAYDKTLEQLVKASADYYLDTYSRTTHIRLVKDDLEFVEIEHELRLTLIASQNNPKAMFETRLFLDQFSNRKPTVQYFQVDGKTQAVEPRSAPGDRPEVSQYVLETPLSGGIPVKVSYAYNFRQSLTKDPFLLWTTTRYIREARHEINFPEDSVECTYQDTSFAPLLERDAGCKKGRLVYVSRNGELIFPGSAFIFMFRRKE